MTNDTGDKRAGSKKAASRRAGPTIELKATELGREPIEDPARPADDVPPAAAPESAAKPEEPHAEPQSAAGDVPPHPPEQSGDSKWDRLPGGFSLPLVGAAAAAAIVFFLAGLAIANLFVGREIAADARLDRLQAVDDLTERLTRMEATLTAPRAPDSALIARIAAAEAAAKLATENAAAQRRRADELAALVRETRSRADAAVVSAEAAQRDSSAATPDDVRSDLETLNQRIASLEQALQVNQAELARRTELAADERKNRVALVSSMLLGAVERGTPFTAELAAAKAVAPDAAALAPLETFAAAGVPSAQTLSRELAVVVPAMLKIADSEAPRSGGFLDKLQANAERLVRIRPVGDVAGDEPAHVIARIEAKAGSSDIAGALSELSKLSPQLRAPAENWIKRANARNAAHAAARQFSSTALAAIGKPNT